MPPDAALPPIDPVATAHAVRRFDAHDPAFPAAFAAFLNLQRDKVADVHDTVAAILADVRQRGDAAVIEYTAQFDRLTLTPESLAFTAAEIDAAADRVDPTVIKALELAASRIDAYHRRQPIENTGWTDDAGVQLGARWRPIDAVGLYVPGGRAAYPSSVLMNAIPARVAGVQRLAITVPTPDGVVNDAVLAAAKIAGVGEVYRVGGAQAVAALTYGTVTIPPVDKVTGPGNTYVTEAKRQVFGSVGIDSTAGPSEILVVADRDNNPVWIAADLLSQAEHGDDSQAVLITDDAGFADAVIAAVADHLRTLPRAAIAGAAWQTNSAVILVGDVAADAPALVDALAPEHLELAVAEPEALADRIHHAGAIFLGRHTPEAVGDYVAGPDHVLPTARSARFSSGLNVLDFMKRTTLLRCDPASLGRIGPAAVTLAQAEGLDAHALSVSLRLSAPAPDPSGGG